MNLVLYIQEVGDNQAAKEFGVKPRTTASWRRRERYPKRPKALEIARIKNWSIEQIYGSQHLIS
jgi:hypothetical protein